jgi:hypothetical protein
MLPDELSEDDESVDMDNDQEEVADAAPTRKSRAGTDRRGSVLNRQQTKEFNKLIKDSQGLIDELNDMDENHHKDENLCFYHVHKPEDVDKLMD